MSEEQFTSIYYEQNYHIFKNVVYRNEDSSGCNAKEDCLRGCFTHFTKEDFKNVKRISDHFTTNGKQVKNGHITRCCCSKGEDYGITHVIVTHKKTQLDFVVGGDCFKKLFADAEDVDTILKELCKRCGEIVAKRNSSRENFCNQKCLRDYEIAERKKRSQKVYLKCVECNAPKKNENQQKWALCYNCKIKEDDSSGDEDTQLFMGSLSIS